MNRLAIADLTRAPNALAPHYTRFRVAERLLLTGHSHQAWPDVGLEGQQEAWADAAELADDKWERALAKAARVKRGFAALLGTSPDELALGGNTHELVTRFLSALDWRMRRRLVTTDGEFHTLRRQLDRLAEAGIEVVKVPWRPAATVGERLVAATDDRTVAVLVSAVFFQDSGIAGGLDAALSRAATVGAELLVDAYHALNVVPFNLGTWGLAGAWVTGGGYKYCQLGEGNCFLRVPPGRAWRPVITGWFSEFSALEHTGVAGVAYGQAGDRFAGATYDPTSHYRAARVFDFFREHELTPEFLRQVSQHQVARLVERFDALDLNPEVVTRDRTVPLTEIGGFLALRAPKAVELSRALKTRGVSTDARGEWLRFGPAPYLSDVQLDQAMEELRAQGAPRKAQGT